MMTGSRHVVIGAGLAGASVAWRLAQAGHEVTVLERDVPANAQGSSHGSARIFRHAYPSRLYTEMVVRAEAGWEELHESSGVQALTLTGAVDHGALRRPTALAEVLEACGVAHELLSGAEARRRWPMFAFETEVLWDPGAGVVDPEAAVQAMLDLAREAGAHVETGWEVGRVERTRTGHRLTSTDGRICEAGELIVCAGGWLPQLLSELPLPAGFLPASHAVEVRQEQAFHFPYRGGAGEAAAWPTFIHSSADITVYGLPGGRDAGHAGQKVAEFNGGRVIPSAAAQDGRVDEANRRRVTGFVAEFLPGVEPAPYAETTCLFTNTASEDFLIDRYERLTVVSPCSGHGAKFAPLIGELALAAVTGEGEVPREFRVV
ncbi:sarcosine oxidase [Nesterenkonia xinjiangensis]|uniref:Sarcosine oxidase n=2 Tax=Nesterenkonia xinjiangensis TaxID=225327 RepID=A0A7Z0GN18_9MICC|nr:FAD-dependent oxidoreductase [Nesterenkonia xinjiangensis]NYJ79022.1 sarcosine oxidase [Nesterenkonia xinjiangensis]